MRYFKLSDDMTVPDRWHLSSVHAPDGTEPNLIGGRRCGVASLRTTISHRGVALDYCLTSFAVPVAKRVLAAAIADVARADVERIPLAIPGHTGFEVLNVLPVIECLDERRSEFSKWTANDHRPDKVGQYRMVTKLRIVTASLAPDAHILRIEGWHIALVVSETIKNAMERSGCVGAKFVEVT